MKLVIKSTFSIRISNAELTIENERVALNLNERKSYIFNVRSDDSDEYQTPSEIKPVQKIDFQFFRQLLCFDWSLTFIVRPERHIALFNRAIWVKLFTLLLCSSYSFKTKSQTSNPNLIIITTDGLRWQEIFKGMDENLLHEAIHSSDNPFIENKIISREELMPFTWGTFAKYGSLYGNRDHKNLVNTRNYHRFSYPGYNEIFCGTFDPFVNSNEKKYNKNVSILEELNHYNNYKNKIAVFSAWELFPYILNQPRSGLLINAGWSTIHEGYITPVLAKLNDNHSNRSPLKGETRTDDLTWKMAMEYTKINHPKILYVSLNDTDHYGHEGDYVAYAQAINQFDHYFEELWNLIQSDSFYKDNTYLLITTDHGRGTTSTSWKKHGFLPFTSGEIWYMEYGPGIKSNGEVQEQMQQYQVSLSYKMAGYLNINFKPRKMPLIQEPNQDILLYTVKE